MPQHVNCLPGNRELAALNGGYDLGFATGVRFRSAQMDIYSVKPKAVGMVSETHRKVSGMVRFTRHKCLGMRCKPSLRAKLRKMPNCRSLAPGNGGAVLGARKGRYDTNDNLK